MIFSKSVVWFLCVLLLASIFMANLLNSIATDHNFYMENKKEGINHTNYLGEKYVKITDSSANIVWFLQVSSTY